jgi:type III pantothenate kinase
MRLAIDCGNTNTKFGLYDGTAPGGRFVHVYRLDSDAGLSADDYRARFDAEVSSAAIEAGAVTGAGLACVVPKARAALIDFAGALTGNDPVEIGAPRIDLRLKVLIQKPAEAGADRLAAAVGAHAGWPGTKIVLDFGTATTFDVVTAAGDYAGGIITPGVNLALDALHAGTAQLPRINVAKPDRLIGTSTVGAMESGIYWGYIGLIEGIVARIRDEYPGEVTVIATGGLAALFAEGAAVINATAPDLTLSGIILVLERNQP